MMSSQMFSLSRWAGGPHQRTHEFYRNLTPALRLVSLMVTESYMLPWLIHLTCGRRKISNDGKTYIDSSITERCQEGKALTLKNLQDLGTVITLSWVPLEDYVAYGKPFEGLTSGAIESLPWFRIFRRDDFPPVPARFIGRADRPIITIALHYREFFSKGFRSASPSMRLRMWFSFAVILVHELAHAYECWINDVDCCIEPYWNRDDKVNELGFPGDCGPGLSHRHMECRPG